MLSLRIESIDNGFKINIGCDCGSSLMTDEKTGERNFSHSAELAGEEKLLRCSCGEGYRLRPQKSHVHVETRA